jgi:hypothetical protein
MRVRRSEDTRRVHETLFRPERSEIHSNPVSFIYVDDTSMRSVLRVHPLPRTRGNISSRSDSGCFTAAARSRVAEARWQPDTIDLREWQLHVRDPCMRTRNGRKAERTVGTLDKWMMGKETRQAPTASSSHPVLDSDIACARTRLTFVPALVQLRTSGLRPQA